MALAKLEIIIVGPDSSFLDSATKEDLGQFFAYLLYHELDQAIAMLLESDSTSLMHLEFAANKLLGLCDVVRKD